MSESSGAQDASTLVLRVSVPDGAEYQAIVKALAAKVAAYLGDADPGGRGVAEALDQVAQVVRPAAALSADGAGADHGSNNPGSHHDEDVVFEFRQTSDEFLIRARSADRSADARRPLPS